VASGDVAVLRDHQRRVAAVETQRRQLDTALQTQRQLRATIERHQRELELERQRRLRMQENGSLVDETFFDAPGEADDLPPPFEL
jgi:multidrug resistance efflux pump